MSDAISSNERSLLEETRKLLRQMRDDVFNGGALTGRSQRAGEDLIHRIDDALAAPRAIASKDHIHEAFAAGWRTAANWADRDDLHADVNSPAYRKDRDEALEGLPVETSDESFQTRVVAWARKCFFRPDALATPQRSFRFIEEALELTQAAGTTREDVLRLVDYVYERPIGSIPQEIGGTMVTLAALAASVGADMAECADVELARCVLNIERIREKDMRKPTRSPLPGSSEKSGTEPT